MPGGTSVPVASEAVPSRRGCRPRLIVAGNADVDLILGPVPAWPRKGTEITVEHFVKRVGGALGNTALALARMGVSAQLVWDVGNDMLGAWLAAELGTGTPPRVLDAPTSVTVALSHPDGERTFVSYLGHLAHSDAATLAAAVETAASGDLLLVGGSFLLPRWRPELPALLERARTRAVVTALDTGWPPEGWSAAVRAELSETLAHVDLFLPNLDEARGLLDLSGATPLEALRGLRPLVAGRTALKLGAAGAATLDASGELLVVSAPATEVVDTVGAGDTSNAVLLAGLRDGLSLQAALRLAVEVTSLALGTLPRRLPVWEALRRRERAVGQSGGSRHRS